MKLGENSDGKKKNSEPRDNSVDCKDNKWKFNATIKEIYSWSCNWLKRY